MLLSIAMMVKNEEALLKGSLDSVRGLGEIIIVDTGSTDRTVEIARKAGARVFHHPWQDDFSLHRNQSLSYCRGEWVLILDADERLEGDTKQLVAFLKSVPKEYNAAMILLEDMDGDNVAMKFNTARLFRRGKVHYDGIVHNKPVIVGGSKAVECPFLRVRHLGYSLDAEKMAAKTARTLGLLTKRIDADPNDFDAYFYRAQIRGKQGDFAGMLADAVTYLEHYPDVDPHESAFFMAANVATALGRYDVADEWLAKGLMRFPDDLDLNYAALELGEKTLHSALTQKGAVKYLAAYQARCQSPGAFAGRFCHTHNAACLARALFHVTIGQIHSGLENLRALVDVLPKTPLDFQDAVITSLLREAEKIGFSSPLLPAPTVPGVEGHA